MTLEIESIRQQFPALSKPTIYFDNPGGTQIARPALERMRDYLINTNANNGGAFATSQLSDRIVHETRLALVDFFNAAREQEIVFGANMTSLTFHISRSLARTWAPGDSIIVTRLDHDANFTPWVMTAEERDCHVRYINFKLEDGTLDLEQLTAALANRPRLLAVGYSSNALGTINPLKEITRLGHEAGALVYADAVHYAPHGPIDVQEIGCDFLVCSAYKFFGPHVGILYGRSELLEELKAYKVRPAPDQPPEKFETGTQNFEGIAGVLGTLEYIEWIGEHNATEEFANKYSGRKLRLKQAMYAIKDYESTLSRAMLGVLLQIPGVTLYGLKELDRLSERVPTFAFNLEGFPPREVAERFAKQDIFVWDGNYYALPVTEALGVEESGGMVRVGPVHYNTLDEIMRFGEALREIATDLDH